MFNKMFGGGKSSKSSTNSTPSAADTKSIAARSEEKNSDAKMMAQSKDYGQDVNPHFICPITGELMTDPVVDNEGNKNHFFRFICAYVHFRSIKK